MSQEMLRRRDGAIPWALITASWPLLRCVRDVSRPRRRRLTAKRQGRPSGGHRAADQHDDDRRSACRGGRPRAGRAWEGDCTMGAGNRSAIGTLVSRTTRFVILIRLPTGRRTAAAMCDGIGDARGALAPHLRRTLTSDQGKELALHHQTTATTASRVYFCFSRTWARIRDLCRAHDRAMLAASTRRLRSLVAADGHYVRRFVFAAQML